MAVVLRDDEIQALFEEVEANEGCLLTVDLPRQNLTTPEGKKYSIEMEPIYHSSMDAPIFCPYDNLTHRVPYPPIVARTTYSENSWIDDARTTTHCPYN